MLVTLADQARLYRLLFSEKAQVLRINEYARELSRQLCTGKDKVPQLTNDNSIKYYLFALINKSERQTAREKSFAALKNLNKHQNHKYTHLLFDSPRRKVERVH